MKHVGRAAIPEPTTAIPYVVVAPPPKRQRGLLVAGLVTAGVIVLALCVLAGMALRPAQAPAPIQSKPIQVATPPQAVATPRVVTERFLNAVLEGNQAAMQEQMCSLLKEDGKKDSSGGLGLGLFVSYKVGEEHIAGPTASVDVELTLPIIGAINFDIYLLQESNTWRVCGGGPA